MKPSARLILILLLILLSAPAVAAEFVVIVHKDNPVEQLDLAEARNIFLGKKTLWSGGRAISVYLQADNDLHRQFCLRVLGKSPRQLQMHWKRILFSGAGVPPRELPDDQSIVQTVAANPRAIGYVDARHLNKQVKVVPINFEQDSGR